MSDPLWIVSFFVGGFLGLYLGSECLVRGGSSLALRLGVPRLVVGITVLALGTSSPELFVNMKAAWDGHGGLALGNVIGSNIANIALVLGLAALIRPVRVKQSVVRREIPVMIVASLLLCGLLWDGRLGRLDGLILLAGLQVFWVTCVRNARMAPDEAALAPPKPSVFSRASWLWMLIGLLLLLSGAHLFVRGAVELATGFGLSLFLIGLTVVAVGTSLPEIALSIVGSLRGEGDLVVGNAIGSNILNILLVLGLTALVFGVEIGTSAGLDLTLMTALALVSLPVMRSGFVITRWEGAILVAVYAAYIATLFLTG